METVFQKSHLPIMSGRWKRGEEMGKTSVREGSYSSKSRLEVKARNSDSKQGQGCITFITG